MTTFLMILSSLAAILLILVVLLQNSKGGGLDSSFGNVSQLGGVAQSTETIEKATWTLAGIIAILSLVAAVKYSPNTEASTGITSEGVSLENFTNSEPLNLPTDLP